MDSGNKTAPRSRMYAILSSGAKMKFRVQPELKILFCHGFVVGGDGTVAPLAAVLR